MTVGFLRCYAVNCHNNQLYQQKGLKKHIVEHTDNEGHLWGFCIRHHKGEKITISKSRYCESSNP